ncbi:MAG: DUF1329 domain-containing protein [Oleiphilaceae bacterium]|nr:DUF1329 domain-containing protein [Oleiphilaceae bacterium]
MIRHNRILFGLVLTLLGSIALQGKLYAKVSQSEADKLGTVLTPFGAIKEGNKAGTIPPWEGGIQEIPENYEGPGHHHPDPFADDKAKLIISNSNYLTLADSLTPGQIGMFETYPDTFEMHIYPTRRSQSLPEWIIKNIKQNAVTSELSKGGVGIKDAYGGIAFPILHGSESEKALQAMWNHMTRWRGIFFKRSFAEITVKYNGDYAVSTKRQEAFVNFYDPKGSFKTLDNVLFYFLNFIESPPRLAGGAVLVHETLDQTKEERSVWDYSASQRRVFRAPNVAYDSPIASSDNTRVADDSDMFNGAPDRYNWKYKGIKEYYIPYNTYKLNQKNVTYKELATPFHLNPDFVRWELHRVHVVEATLKPDATHIYKKRVFYIDEDSWSIVLVDQYDENDKLWRVSMSMTQNFYELPGVFQSANVFHDLQSKKYSINGLYSEEKESPTFENELPNKRHFKPSTLRRRGR